jgi:hypothetical protein
MLVSTLGAAMDAGTANSDELEKCAVLVESASGKLESKVLPSLHVLTQDADATFSLPTDAPPKVKGLMCGRQSIVPRANDYKVLVAGYTLNIIVDDRGGVLEIVDGQLRFRMISGEMTESEAQSVQTFLNESQPFFYAPQFSKGRSEK